MLHYVFSEFNEKNRTKRNQAIFILKLKPHDNSLLEDFEFQKSQNLSKIHPLVREFPQPLI